MTKVVGDRYGGEWPREVFRRHGINYELAEKPKSDLYRDVLPIINSGGVDLLDHDRLLHQLVQLERRTARGGRDTIDHGPGGHDDVANAAAGAVVMAASLGSRAERRDEPPRVVLGYDRIKQRSTNQRQPHSPAHRLYGTDHRSLSDIRAEVEEMVVKAQESVEPVGERGHFARLHETRDDGRERWSIHLPDGDVCAFIWGRAEALRVAAELVETGKISRKDAA